MERSSPATHLENEAVLRLKTKMEYCAFDDLLKLRISFARNIQCWKQVADQTHEDRKIVGNDLRNVEISQSTHQHLDNTNSVFIN